MGLATGLSKKKKKWPLLLSEKVALKISVDGLFLLPYLGAVKKADIQLITSTPTVKEQNS